MRIDWRMHTMKLAVMASVSSLANAKKRAPKTRFDGVPSSGPSPVQESPRLAAYASTQPFIGAKLRSG